MTKVFWKSKTIWFNFLTVIMVFAGHFGYTPNTELVKMTGDFLLVMGPIVNFVLRAFTESKIKIK